MNINNIKKLVSDFATSDGWNDSEEHIQTNFTIPFLKELGWAVQNITVNKGQDINKGQKPDILLRDSDKNTVFVIESKDANKENKLDGKYVSKTFTDQLFNYCESEGVYWGILTNFIEWRVYNTHQKNLYHNKKYAFHDLLWKKVDKTDYIDLFSDEGLKFLERLSKIHLEGNRGEWDNDPIYYPKQDEIKTEFFEKLRNWRSTLRSYIQRTHFDKFSPYEVDLLTQKILDRLIFIDYCSDNRITPQDNLQAILHAKGDYYGYLKTVFRNINEKFNSELFSLAKPDGQDFYIEDEIIREIIESITKIDFKRLSVHVIGEVYEDYLGELLSKSRGGGIKTDEKQAHKKKKSQGIYYTPDYIVDYIVRNTVGERLKKCKTGKEIEEIKVLDPACGSGSFLIRVFDEFLEHYKRVGEGGLFEFDLRKRILTNNIFGVDLDPKAVEIAKLNMMIKALSGISWQDLVGRKLIPSLKLNIRCGNSLIGGEMFNKAIYNESLFTTYEKDVNALLELHEEFHKKGDDEKEKVFEQICVIEEKINRELNVPLLDRNLDPQSIRAFNYSTAFPSVIRNGGFDVIVGNPPYIKEYENKSVFEDAKKGGCEKYYMGKMDIWYMFAEKALDLLKTQGLHSFIAQNNWITSHGAKLLRSKIRGESKILSFVDFGDYKVFDKAGIQTMIYILEKTIPQRTYKTKYLKIDDKRIDKDDLKNVLNGENSSGIIRFETSIDIKAKDATINFNDSSNELLLSQIDSKANFKLSEKEIGQGIVAPQESIIRKHLDKIDAVLGEGIFVITKDELKTLNLSDEELSVIKPFYTTKELHQYYGEKGNNLWIIYTDRTARENIKQFPNIKTHLDKYKVIITSAFAPYGLHRARDKKFFEQGDKIISLRKTAKPTFSFVEFPCYVSQTYNVIKSDRINLKYLTALLNSSLAEFWFNYRGKKQGELFQIDKEPLIAFPIFQPDKEDAKYKEIIELVEEIILSNKKDEDNKEIRLKAIQSKIDDLILELYEIDNLPKH